jgi:hypothetical protein
MAIMIPPIYNTNRPVGHNEANQSDDVRLIQTMLTEYARVVPAWVPSTPLAVDGIYSSNLTAWIRAFQTACRNVGSPVVVDGKIHPMPMDNKFDYRSKFRSGAGSTLFTLNVNLRHKARARHQSLGTQLGLSEPALT